jgi:hypothetical protein
MIWYIIGAVAIFVFGYLVGANNPLASVKAKIKAEAAQALTKVSGGKA